MPVGVKAGVDAAIEALSAAHTLTPGAALDADLADPGNGRQLGMFEAPADDETKIREIEPVERGPGRPAGSTNRRSQKLAAYLASLGHRDPAVTLSVVQNQTPLQLSKALGCDPIEAAAIIISAADKLMPYVHSKLPTAADQDEAGERPMILIGELRARPGAAGGGAMTLEDETEDFLGVPADAPDGVAR